MTRINYYEIDFEFDFDENKKKNVDESLFFIGNFFWGENYFLFFYEIFKIFFSPIFGFFFSFKIIQFSFFLKQKTHQGKNKNITSLQQNQKK
jgi:hypothetical protein